MDGYGQQFYYRPRPVFGFPKLTPAVKVLLYINVGCFFLQLVFSRIGFIERWFALWPQDVLQRFYVWQLVTAMFLHGGFWHLLMNMLPLSFFGFGPSLERFMGTRRFYAVYFLSGIGGNLLYLAANLNGTIPVVGASGAVCGILAAFAMAFPERMVLFFFFYPVKVKWLVLAFFGLELFLELSRSDTGNIAHGAHIGGFVFGWLFMKIVYKASLPFAFLERLKWRVRNLPGMSSVLKPRYRIRKYKPLDDDSFIDQEVDPILEKISKHGIHSLTAQERRILKRARDRMGRG